MRERISDKLRAGAYDHIAEIAELKRSGYYPLLLKAYDELRTEYLYVSRVHGQSHVERVMLLAAVIAMQQRFSQRETELLLIACSYHDVGRLDDSVDDAHGERSADLLRSIPLPELGESELRCIQAAVATHSTKDERLASFTKTYRVPEESTELCRLLCRGLKDADKLDRVRIRDLEVRHLHFRESKALKPTAEAIFEIG